MEEIRSGTQGRNRRQKVKQRPRRDMGCWLAPYRLLNWFSYSAKEQQPRVASPTGNRPSPASQPRKCSKAHLKANLVEVILKLRFPLLKRS